jgi:hypothetical protein
MRFGKVVVYMPTLTVVPDADLNDWDFGSYAAVPDPNWQADPDMVAAVELVRSRMRDSVRAQPGDEVEKAFMYTLGRICSGDTDGECKWILFAGKLGSGGGKTAIHCLLQTFMGKYYR